MCGTPERQKMKRVGIRKENREFKRGGVEGKNKKKKPQHKKQSINDHKVAICYAFVLQQNSQSFPEMSRPLKGRMWRCLVLSKVAPLRCTLKYSGGFCGQLRIKRLELR